LKLQTINPKNRKKHVGTHHIWHWNGLHNEHFFGCDIFFIDSGGFGWGVAEGFALIDGCYFG
jgi:hypothetical protein